MTTSPSARWPQPPTYPTIHPDCRPGVAAPVEQRRLVRRRGTSLARSSPSWSGRARQQRHPGVVAVAVGPRVVGQDEPGRAVVERDSTCSCVARAARIVTERQAGPPAQVVPRAGPNGPQPAPTSSAWAVATCDRPRARARAQRSIGCPAVLAAHPCPARPAAGASQPSRASRISTRLEKPTVPSYALPDGDRDLDGVVRPQRSAPLPWRRRAERSPRPFRPRLEPATGLACPVEAWTSQPSRRRRSRATIAGSRGRWRSGHVDRFEG